MKFFVVLFSLVASTLAQGINIGVPTAGQKFSAGQNFTVAVVKPDTLTGSTDIGVGITLHHCSQNPCESAVEVLGDILFAGAFHPQFINDGVEFGEPHQNYSVQVPVGFPSGPAVLSVPHSVLIGAGPFFDNDIVNVTINIA